MERRHHPVVRWPSCRPCSSSHPPSPPPSTGSRRYPSTGRWRRASSLRRMRKEERQMQASLCPIGNSQTFQEPQRELLVNQALLDGFQGKVTQHMRRQQNTNLPQNNIWQHMKQPQNISQVQLTAALSNGRKEWMKSQEFEMILSNRRHQLPLKIFNLLTASCLISSNPKWKMKERKLNQQNPFL